MTGGRGLAGNSDERGELAMEPSALIQAAATIASGIMSAENLQMNLSPGRLTEIARVSVQMARLIEKEALASYK